jgi:Na+/H+-translocating membrane pyrophosphatase
MSNITKTHKVGIFAMFIAAALVGSVVAFGDNYANAGGKKKSNDSEQEISQNTETLQAAGCNSGNDTTASCNNVGLSFNLNDGNNAVAQQ